MLIFRELSGWNIVYGRRKTGKTFMVKTILRASAIGSPRSAIICLDSSSELLKGTLEPHDLDRISLQNILEACRKELLPKHMVNK